MPESIALSVPIGSLVLELRSSFLEENMRVVLKHLTGNRCDIADCNDTAKYRVEEVHEAGEHPSPSTRKAGRMLIGYVCKKHFPLAMRQSREMLREVLRRRERLPP